MREAGTYKPRILPAENPTQDEAEALFGIRTVEADVKHGLRINGREVKLKGGCLHHDNGVIGAVSVYDAECAEAEARALPARNVRQNLHGHQFDDILQADDHAPRNATVH